MNVSSTAAAYDSIVLPMASIGLLAGSDEGVRALATFGIDVGDFDQWLTRFSADLAEADQALAVTAMTASRWIVAVADTAHGWALLRVRGDQDLSAIVLVCEETLVVAHLLGSTVEWMSGSVGLVARIIDVFLARDAASTAELSAFRQGEFFAGLRISDGSGDLSARDPDRLFSLSKAAESGRVALLDEFVEGFFTEKPAIPAEPVQ